MIPRRALGDVAPMSFAQELIWLLDRATPGLTAYNVPRAIRLRGALDVAALRSALDVLVSRHEILRTTYASDAHGAVQVIRAHTPFELPLVDLTAVPANERDRAAEQFFLEQARTHFDIASDVLLRGHLLTFDADDHVLVLVTHHIASDGWSKGVMFRELNDAYTAFARGTTPTLAPLPIQYADFAIWQRAEVAGGSLSDHLEYWHERLSAPLPSLDLPTDFPRPIAPSFDGARQAIVLPTELVGRLRDLGMDHGATMYMVLLAAYHTVLHRYTGQDDIITGSPTAGRNQAECEGLIGYFANTLAMRTSFAGDPTFGELLERIAENAIGAYEHEDVPFEKLVLELRDAHAATSHTPLFSCVLTMEDTLADDLQLGATQAQSIAIDLGMSKFDITLLVAEQPEGLRLAVWYRTDLFSAAFGERFLGHIRTVLEGAVANPARKIATMPMLTPAEREQLAAWNATTADEGRKATVVELFERQVARVPSRSAVVGDVDTLTYAELNARANQLAHHLRGLGVTAGVPVALLLDRSADAIVGLLGILKAGGAYVPLSVDAPPARLAQQLSESGTTVAVTSVALLARLPEHLHVIVLDRDASMLGALPPENPPSVVSPDGVAYVLYTSGSTGVPKGVAVTHANIVHYTRAVSRVLGDVPEGEAGDGLAKLDGLQFGQAATLAADLGNTTVYVGLLSGSTLHMLSLSVSTEPALFAEYVGAHALDIVKAAPNHFVALAAGKTGAELMSVMPRKWLVLGGEALRLDVARVLVDAGACRMLNHYGPTETTVGVCTFEVTSDSLAAVQRHGARTVPLGRPLANTHAYVVDALGNEQPVGIPGELWLGGDGVSNGYLNRPELTADRFSEFRGERVYHSGDRVRRLPDGTIEFRGRADDQVKVRGYRVELGEIEQALRKYPGVSNGVVVLRTSDGDEARVVAYAVAKQDDSAVSHGDRPTPAKLTAWLAAQLPEYMVPSAVVMLHALPLTANGKVDKGQLPAPDTGAASAAEFVAPRTPTEETVARIWSDVLKRDRVGITESFLELGGHSLLAIRVLGRISKEFGVRLALRALFETPTVGQLSALIDGERQQKETDALNAALAAVESLSDSEVAKMISSDQSPRDVR